MFIYQQGELVWGKGDPAPFIQITANAFVQTMENAKTLKLWPRPEPEPDPEPEVKDTGSEHAVAETGPTGGKLGSGAIPPPPPKPSALSAEGPLRQALVSLFDKARGQGVKALSSVSMKFYEQKGAWSTHQAVATYRDADTKCRFEVSIEGDGIETFAVDFSGTLAKANTVKSFLQPQLQAATDHSFEGAYILTFTSPLQTSKDGADAFITAMTKYGGAEAYVEAQAAAGNGE